MQHVNRAKRMIVFEAMLTWYLTLTLHKDDPINSKYMHISAIASVHPRDVFLNMLLY